MSYDLIATIMCIAAVAAGCLLVSLLVGILVGRFLKVGTARRRYPVARGYVDLEAEAAATEAGFFDLREHILNVHRLQERPNPKEKIVNAKAR